MAEKAEPQQEKTEDGAAEQQHQQQQSAKKRLESSYYSVVSRVTGDGKLMIGQEIEVFPAKECPAFASPGTHAYEARDPRQTGEQFVLLCDRDSIPRVTHIGSYKALKNHHILNLIEAGIVNWPAEGR